MKKLFFILLFPYFLFGNEYISNKNLTFLCDKNEINECFSERKIKEDYDIIIDEINIYFSNSEYINLENRFIRDTKVYKDILEYQLKNKLYEGFIYLFNDITNHHTQFLVANSNIKTNLEIIKSRIEILNIIKDYNLNNNILNSLKKIEYNDFFEFSQTLSEDVLNNLFKTINIEDKTNQQIISNAAFKHFKFMEKEMFKNFKNNIKVIDLAKDSSFMDIIYFKIHLFLYSKTKYEWIKNKIIEESKDMYFNLPIDLKTEYLNSIFKFKSLRDDLKL